MEEPLTTTPPPEKGILKPDGWRLKPDDANISHRGRTVKVAMALPSSTVLSFRLGTSSRVDIVMEVGAGVPHQDLPWMGRWQRCCWWGSG